MPVLVYDDHGPGATSQDLARGVHRQVAGVRLAVGEHRSGADVDGALTHGGIRGCRDDDLVTRTQVERAHRQEQRRTPGVS